MVETCWGMYKVIAATIMLKKRNMKVSAKTSFRVVSILDYVLLFIDCYGKAEERNEGNIRTKER